MLGGTGSDPSAWKMGRHVRTSLQLARGHHVVGSSGRAPRLGKDRLHKPSAKPSAREKRARSRSFQLLVLMLCVAGVCMAPTVNFSLQWTAPETNPAEVPYTRKDGFDRVVRRDHNFEKKKKKKKKKDDDETTRQPHLVS